MGPYPAIHPDELAHPPPGQYVGLANSPPASRTDVPRIGQDLGTWAHKLMTPDTALYSEDGTTVTLTKTWAIGILGEYIFLTSNGSRSLKPFHGLSQILDGEYGLSGQVLSWLKSDREELKLPSHIFRSYEMRG